MNLNKNSVFTWNKKGLIFQPSGKFSHGSHPCVIHYRDDIFLVAFARRDSEQRSHIFLCHMRISGTNAQLLGEPRLALKYGEPGHFDCDGAISACLIKNADQIYLYYVGWQNLPDELWTCNTGRALVDPEKLTLQREFPGPVLGVGKTNPLFAAGTAFHIKDDVWESWYLSCLSWLKQENGKWKHRYGIYYAQSPNGIDWVCDTEMCLPFVDEYEYAFGRPSVIVKDGIYYMWYGHRATKEIPTYRMGFSTSRDGRVWERKDHLVGIDVSPSGWDSEMICYPCVFEHKDKLYMLYNGNGYGKTGFGLAVLED